MNDNCSSLLEFYLERGSQDHFWATASLYMDPRGKINGHGSLQFLTALDINCFHLLPELGSNHVSLIPTNLISTVIVSYLLL